MELVVTISFFPFALAATSTVPHRAFDVRSVRAITAGNQVAWSHDSIAEEYAQGTTWWKL